MLKLRQEMEQLIVHINLVFKKEFTQKLPIKCQLRGVGFTKINYRKLYFFWWFYEKSNSNFNNI